MITIASLVQDEEHVQEVREELQADGVGEENIEILRQPSDVWQRLDGHRRFNVVIKDAALGALIGAVVGSLYGIPAGYLNCRLMDCALATSLELLLLIVVYWVIAGAMVGAIIGLDKLERALYSYMEGVRRGEPLMVVATPEDRLGKVKEILTRQGGSVVQTIE